MTTRCTRALMASIALALLSGCGGERVTTPRRDVPMPSAAATANTRTLAIDLTTPSTTDGGMIFSIEGPNILGVVPAAGIDLVTNQVESNGRVTIDVLVAGPLASGVIAWLNVKGVNSGNAFSTRIVQVAAGASEGFVQRADLSAYRLVVHR